MDGAWGAELLTIAAELDSRISSGEAGDLKKSSTDQDHSTDTSSNNIKQRHVCPEVYKGKSVDFSFQHNHVQVECDDVPEFKDVLTVVLSTQNWTLDRIPFVVRNLRKYYDTKVIIITYGDIKPQLVNVKDVTITAFSAETLESSAINQVVASIDTPFTLITNSLTHFSDQSPLERLVRVQDELDTVGVSSGSYRNLKGLWHHGCLQQRMENYQLAYVRGYEHSQNGCMFCEDVLGPVVVRTQLLREVPLREGLEGSVMYRDWFLTVRMTGKLVVTCPDIMFFVDDEPTMSRRDWQEIAKEWSLQYVQSYDGSVLEFSCEEVGIQCINLQHSISSFILPPCCRQKIRDELGYLQDCAEELGGLYYELGDGSLLGAVKTDDLLPWDFDIDALGDNRDQELWEKEGLDCMRRKGCTSRHIRGSYWILSCEFSSFDFACRSNRTQYLPPEYQHIPTQIEVNGRLTTVRVNPALPVRNQYGTDYLKHVPHWRYTSTSLIPQNNAEAK